MPDTGKLPIGVFDSGVGGLTVVRALMERLPIADTDTTAALRARHPRYAGVGGGVRSPAGRGPVRTRG